MKEATNGLKWKILQLVKNNLSIKTIIKEYKFVTPVKAKANITAAIKKTADADADMDFWNEARKANALLYSWLMEGKNTPTLTDEQVVDTYTKVWYFEGSQNKKIGQMEHFDFLIAAYSGLVERPPM